MLTTNNITESRSNLPNSISEKQLGLPENFQEHHEEEGEGDEYSSIESLLLLAQSEYISHRYAKAINLFKQAVLMGSANAALNLGSIYFNGPNPEIPNDYAAALRYYTRALELSMAQIETNDGCGPDLLDAATRLSEIFTLGQLTQSSHPTEWRSAQSAMYSAEKYLRHKVPIPPLDEPLTESEDYRRAVVIVLLYCRGVMSAEAGNIGKAAQCYCKCIDMPPSTLGEVVDLQQKAHQNLGQLPPNIHSDLSSPPQSPAIGSFPFLSGSPSSPTSPSSPSQQSSPCVCAHCKKEGYLMPMCSRCKVTRYCDMKCQREDYEAHQVICSELVKTKNR